MLNKQERALNVIGSSAIDFREHIKLDGCLALDYGTEKGRGIGSANSARYIERDLTQAELDHLLLTYGPCNLDGLKIKVYV